MFRVNQSLRSLLSTAFVLASLAAGSAVAADVPDAQSIVERSRARYASLHSYSDTGSVITEYRSSGSPTLTERSTFTTSYRAPRQFFLDFRKDPRSNPERYVIWGDGQDFHTWWSTTQVNQLYPHGQGATAIALSSLPTKGAVDMIAPLVFSTAGLHGVLSDFTPKRYEAAETIDGHRCHRISGRVALAYGNGNASEDHAVVVWIDADSGLIRQVFEDTPASDGAGTVNRVTTRFAPLADPPVDSGRFDFKVPT